jgi:hypothetical protein
MALQGEGLGSLMEMRPGSISMALGMRGLEITWGREMMVRTSTRIGSRDLIRKRRGAVLSITPL